MTPSERTWRDDLHLSHLDLGRLHTVETATGPSTKINDFFGLPSASTPPAPDSRVPIDPLLLDAEMGPSWSSADPPRSSSATAHTIQTTISSRLKGQYPTVTMHTRRTRRFLSSMIHSCSPIWYVALSPFFSYPPTR